MSTETPDTPSDPPTRPLGGDGEAADDDALAKAPARKAKKRRVGDPPFASQRMRIDVAESVAATSGGSGMDELMAFPTSQRGSPPPADPVEDTDDEPVAGLPRLPLTEVDGELSPNQRLGPAGEPRERLRNAPCDRLNFRFQRYEQLRVHQAWYRCPVRPDLEVRGVKSAWPRYVAGGIAIGNGMVARIIEATFADATPLAEAARALSLVGPSLRAVQLGVILDAAALLVEPVMDQLRDELAKGSSIAASSTVPTASLAGRRARSGTVIGVGSATAWMLIHTVEDDQPTPAEQRILDQATRKGDATKKWGMDATTRSIRGQWATLRRKIALGLLRQPRAAADGLHHAFQLQQAWTAQPDPQELAEKLERVKAWLNAHHSLPPSGPVAQAAVFGLERWDDLTPLDESGALRAERQLTRQDAPLVWRPPPEVEIETAVTWATLVEGCVRLGVRPWTYLDALLDAVLHDRFGAAADWTPATWAKR